MNFLERKQKRKEHFEKYKKGWRLDTCVSCNGSGYYDRDGVRCANCDGTGQVRISPKNRTGYKSDN